MTAQTPEDRSTPVEHWRYLVDAQIAVALVLACAAAVELTALAWVSARQQDSRQGLCLAQATSAVPTERAADLKCSSMQKIVRVGRAPGDEEKGGKLLGNAL